MAGAADRKTGSYWRLEFIQPPIPTDDRCIMLYGLYGEIVGPLTMQLAQAWLDQFDNRQHSPVIPPARTEAR